MRYGKFEIHTNIVGKYSAKTIGAIKKFIKKHDIDTHGEHNYVYLYENYNDRKHKVKYSLSDFMNMTGYKNAPIKQKEFSREYRHSRFVNVGLKGW